MTNAEYKAQRIKLGYTQDQLATVLGLDRRTVITREHSNEVIRTEARLAILSIKPKNKTK